jgi:hypothetical protein
MAGMDHWATIPIMLLIFLVVSVLELAALAVPVWVIWKFTLWLTSNNKRPPQDEKIARLPKG